MEELVKNALAFIPNYLADLLRLVQGPKRFAAEKTSQGDKNLKDSLIFFAISILLAWILESAPVGHADFLGLATAIVYTFISGAAYGAAICLAWRLVRGDAEAKAMFLVSFYYAGVFQLLAACWFMAVIGAVRAADPPFYTDFVNSIVAGTLPTFLRENGERYRQSPAFLPGQLVTYTGMAALLLWLIAGWDAYRQLNHRSKLHSALAALLFALLSIPITACLFLIASAGAK